MGEFDEFEAEFAQFEQHGFAVGVTAGVPAGGAAKHRL
jgi:hypothetical protein